MEVEVMVPPVDFNFDSNCSSPFITAPSSPQFFAASNKPNFFFFSAPTSPTRATSSSFHEEEQDFQFNFSGHLDRPSLSAAELFDGGKIRPLKPPPLLQSPVTSPRSKLSPRNKKKDLDPFALAMKETLRSEEKTRGRERVSVSFSGRKGSRSLSPLRISVVCDSEDKNVSSSTSNINNSKASFLSSIPFTRKWRFKDFLLFRSASEGRATDKDPLRRKYAVLSKNNEDVRDCSFRSTESSSGSISKRRGPVSAHELHYTLNRAASEEMKKKTFLPYKQGLLGCLGFNPGMHHHFSKRVGSLTRS
ncbi:uncharacterized protein LOC114419667 [Glycine soja]|uniref:Uncharacterized protein n=1 Tax=Glycine soja TaxID=3848 RepID=A0A445JZJ7_GLYSO|nr:uncharacterized protein LOC114419667 [Glycine soja]RZC03937.1 hypothetical protein D0Y65_018537 [Glycine soja]